MDIFSLLLIILFIATAIFYVVFFSFVYYWHAVKMTYIIVPLLFTFEFFAIGFFVVCIASLIVQYYPVFLSLIFRQ